MSNERVPVTPADMLNTQAEFERRCDILESVSNDVSIIVKTLQNEAHNLEDSDERIHARMMRTLEWNQLEKLMNIVSATVDLERYENVICLDDPELLTINDVRELYENATGGIDPGASDYTVKVLRDSEKQAVDYLTACLAPDQAYRDIALMPWHRNVFGKSDSNEEFTVAMETIIPGFIVDFYYKPGENFPERLAHLTRS